MEFRVHRMAQWVKVLAIKPSELNFISGTHMVEGENWFLPLFSDITHAPWHEQPLKCTQYMYMHANIFLKLLKLEFMNFCNASSPNSLTLVVSIPLQSVLCRHLCVFLPCTLTTFLSLLSLICIYSLVDFSAGQLCTWNI